MAAADARILDYITYSAGTDRAELTRELALPRPTVVSAVRRLLAAGEVVELDAVRRRNTAGRPPRLIHRAGPATAIGTVSWDGDRLHLACVDTAGSAIESASVEPSARGRSGFDLEGVGRQVVEMTTARSDYRLRQLVFSVPAPFLTGRGAPAGRRAADPVPNPFAVSVPGDLESQLSVRLGLPVVMENDANLGALGEYYAGAAQGVENVVYLKINNAGFGAAIIANGALVRGARGYAGELAHLQVDADGPLCACGGRGCLTYRVRNRVVESAQTGYDYPVTFGDLPKLAETGDAGAIRLMRDMGRELGGPLAHLCTLLDPDLLLIGGLLGPSAAHVVDGIRDVLTVSAPPAIADSLVVASSSLGLAAETLGAVEIARVRARRP